MKHATRITLYLLGFFFLATGVNLAILSNLGVSPVSSLPLAISNISGISLGVVTTSIFVFYVLLQVAILRREFKIKGWLQVLFGFVFGFFVDLTSYLLTWVVVTSYIGQLLLLLISCLFVAVGLLFIIAMDIVPGAPEGFILAICEVTNIPFSTMKVWFDCTCVFLAAILSLAFLGNISSIREGTIISALIIGRILGVLIKSYQSILEKVAFGSPVDVHINSKQAKG